MASPPVTFSVTWNDVINFQLFFRLARYALPSVTASRCSTCLSPAMILCVLGVALLAAPTASLTRKFLAAPITDALHFCIRKKGAGSRHPL